MTPAPADTGRVAWHAPASYLQEQLYRSVAGRMSNYNVVVAWRLLGPLDRGALRHALGELAVRHEILRTSLDERNGAVEQHIHHHGTPALRHVDLRSAREPGAEVRNLVLADVSRPFDLREVPLWRAVLARLDEHDHVLALVLHHAVCDGWSSKVMERDLTALYRAAAGGEEPALPALPIQFGDVASWERSVRDAPLEQQWRARLSPGGASPVPLRALRDRPPFELICHPIPPIAADVAGRLAELAGRCEVTLPTLLYAAAIMTLSPVLGAEITFGLAHANRADIEVQPVVGPVFDYLPIRVDLADSPSLGQLAGRIRQEERAARDRVLPLVLVEQAVTGGNHGPGAALFDLVLNFIPSGRAAVPARTGPPNPAVLRFEPFAAAGDWVSCRVDHGFYGAGPLSFVLRQSGDGELGGQVYGHAGALGWPGLARLGHRFRATVHRLLDDPTAACRPRHRPAPA